MAGITIEVTWSMNSMNTISRNARLYLMERYLWITSIIHREDFELIHPDDFELLGVRGWYESRHGALR